MSVCAFFSCSIFKATLVFVFYFIYFNKLTPVFFFFCFLLRFVSSASREARQSNLLVPKHEGLELPLEPGWAGRDPRPDQIHPQVQTEVSASRPAVAAYR